MNIAIFGSCVSRDTCEFIADAQVLAYVARQSVTSLLAPHGMSDVDVTVLDSNFQRRMVESDLVGSGAQRILEKSAELDVVLIDLVDERRGYWKFPDGTSMTNSLEVEMCGAGNGAQDRGAVLVDFGTDEHFDTWVRGFDKLVEELASTRLVDRAILLDIEWARAMDDAFHAPDDGLARLGRRWRRTQRRSRDAYRRLRNGAGWRSAWDQLRHVRPTEAEEFADRAKEANRLYARYRDHARTKIARSITRTSSEVRIDSGHKWGPQPFHYREADYLSIVESIKSLVPEPDSDDDSA